MLKNDLISYKRFDSAIIAEHRAEPPAAAPARARAFDTPPPLDLPTGRRTVTRPTLFPSKLVPCVEAVFACVLLLAYGLFVDVDSVQASPQLIVSPTAVSVGGGETATYTVHFDGNPAGFAGVECGDLVYVNMRGFDYSTLEVNPHTPAFRTGTDCTGGNWDRPRTIQVKPVAGTEATVTISHAVWDDHGGTPLADTDTPKVVVTIYDNDPPPSEPPWVSIEAGSSSTLTEGDPVTFTLTRGNDDITQTRTVIVRVSESGTMLSGSPPTSVEFAANSAIATLEVQTVDDQVDEDDSEITATITASSEFQISGQAAATATVRDNDTDTGEDEDDTGRDTDTGKDEDDTDTGKDEDDTVIDTRYDGTPPQADGIAPRGARRRGRNCHLHRAF